MPQQPPTSTLFPYTTLFRSQFTYINKTVVDFIARPLLKEIFVDGKQVHELPDLEEIKEYAKERDRKSTRLNSSHVAISYAVFCLKKKIKKIDNRNTQIKIER